ncbi:glutathione S-transferase [Methylopila capsulata]|uniref:Glutathione S-transferase n=1 Tax=Methylopila capsulata TaxID=61654 RepID=A0A9W6ISV2_9HYPH|nr:glutathione S-transferase [Methylopila capsulata]MBM7851620.1 glutathione S-transferase [Methylopila capsulata]GLK54680.1 glutathione S-transferase [Methylopila capsulata]
MPEYLLRCFAESGNSYKPAILLELAGADWAPVFVDYFHGETREAEYRALNVMGEAPVLEHGDVTLSQSGVILDYLADALGAFGAETPAERREIWRWILFDNHKLTSYTATLRFMRAIAKTGETPVTDFLHKRAEAAYAVLDAHLAGKTFVVGERPTIADLSLSAYLFFGDEIGVPFEPYANIRAWLERIRSLPGWKHPYDLMPREKPAAA